MVVCFKLKCVYRKFCCCCLVTKSCPTLLRPHGGSPGSSIHWISQTKILEWVVISFSRGSSWARDGSCVSCIGRLILFHWTNWEAHINVYLIDNNPWCVRLNSDCITLVLVAQLCPTFCDPMYSSPPGSSVHEILQAKILECIAILFSKGSSRHRDQTWVSCIIGRWILYQLSHQRCLITLRYFILIGKSTFFPYKFLNSSYTHKMLYNIKILCKIFIMILFHLKIQRSFSQCWWELFLIHF